MKHYLLVDIFLGACTLFLFHNKTFSQELRSGDLTYVALGPQSDLHIQAHVAIFTDASINTRHYLHLNWGDGTIDSIAFPNPGSTGCNSNYYYFGNLEHFYANNGTYNIHIVEPFYIDSINNIINSSTQPFYLEATVILSSIMGVNSSPQHIYPQECLWIDTNTIFDMILYDSDPNDSLSFELLPSNGNYIAPNCRLDSIHGDLLFFPDSVGKYAIFIKINEWRNSYLIGTTIRQMLLDVNGFVSVNDLNMNSEITIFPTPTNNYLSIQSQTPIESETITDVTGKIIYSRKLSGTKETLDVSGLCSGLYFLIIGTDKGIITRKFIKD